MTKFEIFIKQILIAFFSEMPYDKQKADEGLEKKGVSLRGIALFPLIRYLFTSQSVHVPPISPEIISGWRILWRLYSDSR